MTFNTKSAKTADAPFDPPITINLTMPDGRKIDKTPHAEAEAFSASKDGCDVRIGDNPFAGDLNCHDIKATIEDVSVQIELVAKCRHGARASGLTHP